MDSISKDSVINWPSGCNCVELHPANKEVPYSKSLMDTFLHRCGENLAEPVKLKLLAQMELSELNGPDLGYVQQVITRDLIPYLLTNGEWNQIRMLKEKFNLIEEEESSHATQKEALSPSIPSAHWIKV